MATQKLTTLQSRRMTVHRKVRFDRLAYDYRPQAGFEPANKGTWRSRWCATGVFSTSRTLAPRHGFEPQLCECLDDQQLVDCPIFQISGIAEKTAYFYVTFTRVLAEEAVALMRFEPRRYPPTSIWPSPPRVVCAASLPEALSPPQGSHGCPRGAPVSQESPDTHSHLGSIHTANAGRGRACESLIRFSAHGHAAHPVFLLRSAGNSNPFVS